MRKLIEIGLVFVGFGQGEWVFNCVLVKMSRRVRERIERGEREENAQMSEKWSVQLGV